jgi:hypothetical protein
LRDLLAQVLLLDFELGFGIGAFEAADEETEKAADEVADSTEHKCVSVWKMRRWTRRAEENGRKNLRAPEKQCGFYSLGEP